MQDWREAAGDWASHAKAGENFYRLVFQLNAQKVTSHLWATSIEAAIDRLKAAHKISELPELTVYRLSCGWGYVYGKDPRSQEE